MRKRTRARELALQALYQLDLLGDEALEGLGRLLEQGGAGDDVRSFALELVHGCRRHRDELDARISATATNWALGRMAVVDRNILRLAVYELLYLPDTPAKVAINEAVDLAKRFSTGDSGAFVNGILDHIRAEASGAAPPPPAPSADLASAPEAPHERPDPD